VGDLPVLLAGVIGREQAVVDAVADFLQADLDRLGEAVLVADLISELVRIDEDDALVEEGEAEDGACKVVTIESNRGQSSIPC
jgi:hypothetical protein